MRRRKDIIINYDDYDNELKIMREYEESTMG